MIISEWYERRRLQLLARYGAGKTILDVGYSQLPNPYFDLSSHVVGIDLDPPPEDCSYQETIEGDATEITSLLPGRQFDAIVCGELIEHLEEPYRFLRALRPALAPGGTLVISTPNPLAFPVILAEITRSHSRFYTEDHTFYYLPRWTERLLNRSGYDLVRTAPVGLWNPWFAVRWAPVWMSYQLIYVAQPQS